MRLAVKIFISLLLVLVLVLAGFRVSSWLTETRTATEISPENGRYVQTEFGRIHFSVWGEVGAQPIVMTHGMAAWGGLWRETAVALAKHGYQVFAVDQTPFGFSDRGDFDFSKIAQAKKLNAGIQALNLSDYIMVGHSYGGGVAMETALRYPEKMSKLILVCPVLDLAASEKTAETKLPLPLRSDWLAQMLVSTTVTNPLLTSFLTKQFMHKKDALSDEHIRILQSPITLKGNTEAMVIWLRQFLTPEPEALSGNPSELAKLQVPLHLIWGQEDTVTPIAQGKALSLVVAPTSFVQLPEIGHMPQLEDNALFNKALLPMLATKVSIFTTENLRGSL